MKRQRFRSLALLLAVCLLTQTVSAAALGGVLRESGLTSAAGIDYYETTYWHTAANGRQTEHYLTYNANPTVTPSVFYGTELYGRSTLDELTAQLSESGRTVVAAVNGSFFDPVTGIPIGLVVTDGILRSSGDALSIGFYADGSAIIGTPGLAVRAQIGTSSVQLHYNKALSQDNGAILYSRDYDEYTKSTVRAYNVILQPETTALTLSGSVQATVLYAGEAYYAEIPEGCFTLSMALGTPYSYTLSLLQSLSAGDTLTIETTCDDAWKDVVSACSGGELLVQDGIPRQEFTLISAEKRTGRTAIGLRSDGTLVVYTIDGLQSGYSLGITLAELADRMAELGCVIALNLDGGGSTTASLCYPGYDAPVTVNSPSDGKQRTCANFLVFTMPTAPASAASRLYLYPQQTIALPGAQITLDARAADANYRAAAVPSSLTYRATLGSVTSDGVYTAAAAGTATITAYSGVLRTTATVTVLESPDSISVWRNATNVTGTTVAVAYGDTIDFSATAKQAGFSVACTDNSFTWSVSGDVGSVDETGIFTADGTSLEGTLTVSCGSTSVVVPLLVTDPDSTPPLISMQLDGSMLTATVTDDLSGIAELTLTCDDLPAAYEWDGQTLTAQISDDTTIVKLTAADRFGNRAGAFIETGYAVENIFADLQDNWASKYVNYLNRRGVLQGSYDAAGNLNYNPSDAMTRQAFITSLIRWLGIDTSLYDSVELPFADAENISTYALPSIRAAYALGYLNGREVDGQLYSLPKDTVTRQEAMAILGRSQPGGYLEDNLSSFADADQVSSYARSHIAQMITRGIISGSNGMLNPRATVTRAQLAKMLFYLT